MATATSKLNIIIAILGDDTGKLTDLKSGLDLASQAFGQVKQAAQQAWDAMKEGAALELTARQFRNVAENAGYAADTLLGKMRKATSGMVTDAELMASGLQIIELGLADNEQSIVDLSEAISVLGLNMDQVIMTLANNSELRLDSLGLSVEGVRKRVAELNAEGFDGDAFDQAVIEGLTKRMEVLGDTSETTAGQIAILETEFANLKDEAKSTWATIAGPVVSQINESRGAVDLLSEAYNQGAITTADFYGLQVLLRTPLADTADVIEYLTGKMNAASDADLLFSNYQRQVTTETQALNVELTSGTNIIDFYAQNAQAAAQASRYRGTQIRREKEGQDELNSSLTVAGQAYSDISTSVFSLTQRIQDQLDFLAAGGGALLELAATAEQALDEGNFEGAQEALDAAAEGAIDLDLELGKIDPAEAAERLEALGYGPEEAKTKVEELQASLFALTSQNYVIAVDLQVQGAPPGTYGQNPPGSTGPAPAPTGPGPSPQVGAQSGFGTGGASTYVLIDTVYVQGDGQFLEIMSAQAQAGRRNLDSDAAGASYVGA